jgi:hypothetical protein
MNSFDISPVVADSGSVRRTGLAAFWGITGALGAVGALPYAMSLTPSLATHIPVALPIFAIAQFVQACAVLMLLSWIGLRLGQAIGLGSPLARALVYRTPFQSDPKRTLAVACVAGVLVGAALIGMDKMFAPLMPPTTLPASPNIDLWKRILACFYGGISEELITRLFLMTLIIWVLGKIARKGESSPAFPMIVAGVVGAAILFGLGHLPAAAQVWPLTPTVVARTVLLNAAAGIPFGFLYWRWGLEHAMCAHFFADIVVHVVGGG